jgi:large subunit ribosomal protein L25
MNVVPLTAETGRSTGKGASRRLRAEGRIPGTVYGLDQAAATVSIARSELRRALTTPAGVNALIELSFDGASSFTLVKEIQRHPVRRDPIHVDLQRIDPEVPMSLSIPLVLEGEPKKVTSNGGMVDQTLTHLAVSVRPDSIPNEVRVNVADLEIDHTIHVSDLALPNGVTSETDPETPVVVASLTRAAMMAARAAAAAEHGEEFIDEDALAEGGGESESAGSDDSGSED